MNTENRRGDCKEHINDRSKQNLKRMKTEFEEVEAKQNEHEHR